MRAAADGEKKAQRKHQDFYPLPRLKIPGALRNHCMYLSQFHFNGIIICANIWMFFDIEMQSSFLISWRSIRGNLIKKL